MFAFFKRVSTVMSSELNALLNKAEDPVKMLDQLLRDMEKDLQEAETTVSRQMATCKMFEKKVDDALRLVEKREKQALEAIEVDNEDLARRLLEDKQKQQKNYYELKDSYEIAKADVDSLKEKLKEMKEEYHSMKLKKDSLKVRAESAKMKSKLNRSISSIGSDEAKQSFERIEEKVLQYEAEAETTSGDFDRVSTTSLDDEVAALKGNNELESELMALKKKVGKE
ncbi:PspA/IM30 family protein [Bacillus sp. FJAT-45350]|uniref:PspA/IM30 family protein n=1 Tax=Bacillus sp. FJAT-45350 TaxID=2011014 RepID=UPI000BB9262D|nr:PspA/IM30 family protein [Bacillus sp. FJAT-45350]